MKLVTAPLLTVLIAKLPTGSSAASGLRSRNLAADDSNGYCFIPPKGTTACMDYTSQGNINSGVAVMNDTTCSIPGIEQKPGCGYQAASDSLQDQVCRLCWLDRSRYDAENPGTNLDWPDCDCCVGTYIHDHSPETWKYDYFQEGCPTPAPTTAPPTLAPTNFPTPSPTMPVPTAKPVVEVRAVPGGADTTPSAQAPVVTVVTDPSASSPTNTNAAGQTQGQSTSSSSGDGNKVLAIALGVGLGGGLALVLMGSLLLWKRRQNMLAKEAST